VYVGRFSGESAPIHFPGAPFLCAMLLSVGCLLLFRRTLNNNASQLAANERQG
jgi:hypothetical protein